MKKRIFLVYLLCLITLPADIMYWLCNKEERSLLDEDLLRYAMKESPRKKVCLFSLNYCLLFGNTFRNVFYFRIHGKAVLKGMSKIFLKPVATVEIGGTIGGGLRINHNCAVVFPYQAGKNLTVGPNVVIGKGPKKDNGEINAPIIGDDVEILPNSVVTGGIKIGSNTTIAAGTIVTKSVPDHCVCLGNPGRIYKQNGVVLETEK